MFSNWHIFNLQIRSVFFHENGRKFIKSITVLVLLVQLSTKFVSLRYYVYFPILYETILYEGVLVTNH